LDTVASVNLDKILFTVG